MASKFVLTAQLQLQAPTNIAQVVSSVNKQLQGVQMNINPVVNAKSLNQANQAVQQVGVSAKVASKSLNSAAGSAGNLGSALGAAARRFASITLATGFFLALTRAVGSAVGRAIEFEKEMLKISQVTGKTLRGLSELSNEVTRLSTTLGVSSEELLNAARTLSQAGFAAEKVTGAIKILAQTDLAATFDNIKDTTEGAVAILSQFRREVRAAGGEVQFLEMAMDSINSVSKSFAVESSDLISVVRRTGGVFEAAGGKLNELIALFTSVRATTRETADTIATGFRTIFTRIQRSETIDSLKELGIVLQDTEGKFVGPMEAIARLSAGLKALDPRDFRFNEIVEQLGGFRQIGKVIPLIKQYSTSTAALSVANNSLGSTAKDAAIAQQGLGNQFAQLKEKFDATIRSLADSSTFQTLATSAIKMAEAILRIVDALEPLLPMLTALAAFKLGKIAVPALGKFAGVGANSGGKIQGFASGGMVPGRGNRDTVPAVLTPGEFVMRKSAVKKIGANNMADMNAKGYAAGGTVTKGRGIYGAGLGVYDREFGAAFLESNSKRGKKEWSQTDTIVIPKTAKPSKDSKSVASIAASGVGVQNMLKKVDGGNFYKANKGLVNSVPRNMNQYFMDELSETTKTVGRSSPKEKVYNDFIGGVRSGILEGTKKGASAIRNHIEAPPVEPIGQKQTDNLMKSINDGAKGAMFEQVLGAFGGSAQFGAVADPQSPFDFNPGQFGPLDAFSSVLPPDGFIEAKARQDLTAKAYLKPKIINQAGQSAGRDQVFQSEIVKKVRALGVASTPTAIPKATPKATPTTGPAPAGGQTSGFTDGSNLNLGGVIRHYAKGGKSDTVPAMLTPGEYVVNKSSAQSIGYANLHRMNQSNGVNGYAAGGIVGSTRNNYGELPGGAGGGSIGTIPGIESASKGFTQLAKSIGDLVGQIMRAGQSFTAVTDDFAPLQTAIADAATGISRVDNIMIEAINGAVSQLSIGMSDAAKGISTVDNLLTNAIIAAVVPLEKGMINAANGIAITDDVMLKALTAGTAPIKASVGELTAGFKKFGEQLKTKLVYFDVLKKANTDLVTVMEKLGTVLMEKADDFDILKPPLTAVEASLMGLSEIVTAQDAIFIPLRNAVANLTGAMNRQAQGSNITVNVGGGSAALVAPMGRMVKATSAAAIVMSNIALFGARLETAMMNFTRALGSGSVGIQNVTINTGATSVEMKRLQKELAEANLKIEALEQAAIEATTRLKQTKTPVGGAGGAGGGMMGGMGNNLMMGGMMGGMMVQSMEGVSDGFKALVTDITMVGMMFGMVAMSMKGMLAKMILSGATWITTKLAETAASSASTVAKTGETMASMAAAGADSAEAMASMQAAGAAALAAGILVGLSIAATALYARFNYLNRQAKELTDGFTDGMKDMQKGMTGKSLAQYQAEVGRALQKEAEASSGALWGTVATVIAVVAAVGFAIFALVSTIAAVVASAMTFGAASFTLALAGVAIAGAITAAAAAGQAIGEGVATVEEGLKNSTMALSASAYYASKALGDLGNANKQMGFEMLEGSELLSRQTAAITQFSIGLNSANTQMEMFKNIDASMDREIRTDMIDSDVFSEIKELGEDAMRELAKTAYQSAKTLQGSLNNTMQEFQESGRSFTDSMDSKEIQGGLAAYSMAVRDATALNLMQNGSMKALAQAQLGLRGVTEDSMSSQQRANILAREQELVQKKAMDTAEKARAAQEKSMKDAADAADKADKAAAQKLAADQEMARSAYRVADALNVFGNALMGLEQTSAIVNVAFSRLTGTITQFKNDTEKQISSLKSGKVTDESAAAARTVGAEFGIGPQVEKVLASIQETERIRKSLTIKGMKAFSGTLTESAANLRWNDFLKTNDIDLSGLSEDVRGEILTMLEDGLQPAEIEKIIGYVNDANKQQIEMLQKLAKARNNYLSHLFKFGGAIAKADKKFRESIVRMTKVVQTAAERMAKATGRDVGVGEVAGNEQALRDANLGVGLRAGNPAEVGRQLTDRTNKLKEIDREIANLAATAGNDEAIIKLQNEQRKLGSESKQLTENLKSLANQAKLAAAIMGEIEKEKGKRDAIRGLISEFTFASNKGREQMDRNFMSLQRVMQTGNLNSIPDEQRSAVGGLLDQLKDIAIGPQGQTGGDIKKQLEMQMANQLKIRATGKPLTAEEMDKIFNKTTKEEQLIDALKDLAAQEQQAAAALAQQDHDVMRDLIGSIKELVITLQNAQVDAGAEAGGAVEATTLSNGGVVYAAEGQKISGRSSRKERRNKRREDRFKAKGTDTVPAMLTEGEYVVNKKSAQKNMGLLEDINSGTTYAQNGGKVQYLAKGGQVGTLDNYNTSAMNMMGDLKYDAIWTAATNAGQSIGDQEKQRVKALNEKSASGIPGSDVLEHLQKSGISANEYMGGIRDVLFPVYQGGDAWKGLAQTDPAKSELQFAGFGNDVKNVAQQYIDLKKYNPVGSTAQDMGSSSGDNMSAVKDAIMKWQYNMGYFWGINGEPGWKKDDTGMIASWDLPEWLDDNATDDLVKKWEGWTNYPRGGSRAPQVFGSQFWAPFYNSFLSQGQQANDHSGVWWTARDVNPLMTTDDVDDINEGDVGVQATGDQSGFFGGTLGMGESDLGQYVGNLMEGGGQYGGTVPDPPYVENGGAGANMQQSWDPSSADFGGSGRGNSRGFYIGSGKKQIDFNDATSAAIYAKRLTDMNPYQPDTKTGGIFDQYGSEKLDLLKAAYGAYAFDLNKAFIGGGDIIKDYLGGSRGWHNSQDSTGTGIKDMISSWSPSSWQAGNPEGVKLSTILQGLLGGSAQESRDRAHIGSTQVAFDANNWDKIFGIGAGTDSIGVIGDYKLNTPEYAATIAAGQDRLDLGTASFGLLDVIPEVGDGYDQAQQIEEVAMWLQQLSDEFGLNNNFVNQFAVAQEQAAEAAAGEAADALAGKEGFVERNKQLNKQMNFGDFTDRAGLMKESQDYMMENKIFNARTPAYALRNGVPNWATRLHKVPPTDENFDALFPYSLMVAQDLNNMTKGNLLTSLGADGMKYNVAGVLGSLGNVVKDDRGFPTFEGAKRDGEIPNINNIIQTIEDGNWEDLNFLGGRQFFGVPQGGFPGGLLGTYIKTPYPDWYTGIDGYKGLGQDEIDTSDFYFKDSIAAGGLPNNITEQSESLWEAIVDKWQAGVAAIQNAAVGPQPLNAVAAAEFATGGHVGVDWSPRGTDTVPAMLTPGEFVMKKSAVDKYGTGFMSAVNGGNAPTGGGYMAGGGSVSQSGPPVDTVSPERDATIAKIQKTGVTTFNKVSSINASVKSSDLKVSAIQDATSRANEILLGIWGVALPGLESLLFNMDNNVEETYDMVSELGYAASLIEQKYGGGAGVNPPPAQGPNLNLLFDLVRDNKNNTTSNFGTLAGSFPGINFGGAAPAFMATGGMARGTDTVPAMLTPGEFVMKKSAVDKYGTGFMRDINNGVQGFAKGGPVRYLKDGSIHPVTAQSGGGGGGGGGGGFGDIVSLISSSLDAFTQAFTLFSGLSSMLGNIINSMADMHITHNININGSLNIPGFSEGAIKKIGKVIANDLVQGIDEKIKQAFDQRDLEDENK